MAANLVANVTISGNLRCFSTLSSSTANVATGFAIGGPYINASYGARVAGGLSHTAVIMQNGSIRTFGENTYGQLGLGDVANRQTPGQVPGVANARSVACGSGHTAVLLVDGTVRMFGRNDVGQLGLGDTTTRLTPVQITGLSVALAVSCGFFHTAVLLYDGTVRTFGSGGNGRLGLGDAISRLTPVQVTGISSGAVAVACGAYHTSVLLRDGTVRVFGYNNTGQLGLGDVVSRLTPVQVTGISSSAVAVSGGKYHTAILLADGTLRTFGFNTAGQLGVNDTTSRQTPVQVTGITSATTVSCGLYFTSVLLADGTVRTFGSNFYGQNGVNDTTNRPTPGQVFGISSSATAIAGGGYHAAVLLADGSVRTFGRNTNGQLGTADTASRLTPVQVVAVGAVTAPLQGKVSGGQGHTAIVMSDGTVRVFGRNDQGQLGVNDTISRLTPVQVWGISSSATAVACGLYHTAVLLANGTVMTFGANQYGYLGVNDTTTRQTPVQVFGISTAIAIACGFTTTMMILANGTVWSIGLNTYGQLGVNDTVQRNIPVQVWGISSSAVAIACQQHASAVLLANGTVRTFGRNTSGELGVNDNGQRNTPVQVWEISSSAIALACGRTFTAVLLANGTIRTFGTNGQGQIGVNDTATRQTPVQVWGISSSAVAVACGYYHASVTLQDGTLRVWGFNSKGQLGVNDTVQRNTPVQVWGISSSAVGIAGGQYHTAVLLTNGTARTFGRNDQGGQLGVGDTTQRNTPVQVFGITTAVTPAPTAFLTSAATSITLAATGGQIWTSSATGVARTTAGSVAGSNYHTVVVLKDGTVRTFGGNGNGQLGVGDTTSRLTPVQVTGLTNAATVGCGFASTFIILNSGQLWSWGSNSGGLGLGDTTQRLTPVQVTGITSATVVSQGPAFHTAIITSDGALRVCGSNFYGQLGIGDTTSRLTFVQVSSVTSATAVACGESHTAVVLSDGTVRTFGYNAFCQLGVNDTTSRLTPVQVWGISSSATAVACSARHTVVLLSDGTVRTFGNNQFGQLGVNDTTSRQTPVTVLNITSATAVTCGYYHTAVLLADGTIRTFGRSAYGNLGINDTNTRLTPVQVFGISSSATAVSAGGERCVVLLADGSVRTFGRNDLGQLGVNDTTNRSTPVAVFGILGSGPFTTTYVTAQGLALGLSAPTFQLDLSTDKARKLSTTTWTTGSDRRIKSDIQSANLARCVDIVDSLDLKYFKWDIPGVQDPQDTHALGWIAQDVKQFFPNSVRQTQDYGFDDFHNLDSDQLIKTMYGALKKMCEDTYGSQ